MYFIFWNQHQLTEKLQGKYREHSFSEMFERKLPNECPIIPKCVSVYFLQIKTFPAEPQHSYQNQEINIYTLFPSILDPISIP